MSLVEDENSFNQYSLTGFDTTANTLAFTSYYLAKNQQVQDRLRAEIEEVCKSATPSYDELGRLKYSDAIMKETLRLHPIASTSVFAAYYQMSVESLELSHASALKTRPLVMECA